MATLTHIPNPVAISVKTAGYTIPANRYARVIADCDSGGTVTINGVNALVTSAFLNIDQSGTNNITYTVPSGYFGTASFISQLAAQFRINSNRIQSYNADTYTNQFSVGPGGTFEGIGAGTNNNIQGYATPSGATNRIAEFFLPTGTVINGTGTWRAVVEEYRS
jgi:hypothetical protein